MTGRNERIANCVRRGVTLVEAMVVVAVLAILMAMLVPAVQKVREAAQRTQCLNNLFQVGCGLHNYHDSKDTFPPGAVRCPGNPSSIGYGISFWVQMMPFMEQHDLYRQMDLYGDKSNSVNWSTGWTGVANDPPAANKFNSGVLGKAQIGYLRCPASPFPTWSLANNLLQTDYIGIAGSVDNPHTSNFGPPYYPGTVSKSGILIPDNAVSRDDVFDGLSNTMVVGEQSDFCRYASGTAANCRGACYHGFSMGLPNHFPPKYSQYDGRTFNLTTIRYKISKDATLANSGANCGTNSPLQSAHFGGVMILMADGSVHFLLNDVGVDALKRMADRNDGSNNGIDL